MLSFGSAQTNGLPVLVTAITQGTRQLVHTFPAGSATPNVVELYAWNLSTAPAVLNIAVEDSGATILRQITVAVPVGGGLFKILNADNEEDSQLIQNGSSTIKVWSDTASALAVSASVDDQSSVAGAVSQNIASGLVASVQNASRYAVGAQGGTGQATEANANLMIDRAGTLRNLSAKVDAAVGGGATLTITVRKNGAGTAQTLTLANADSTTLKVTTGAAISVVAGDLITFQVSCDNAGAPAANVHAAVEFV